MSRDGVLGVHEVPDAAAMQALGRRIGLGSKAGDLVILSGPLGAGKTTLTRGIGDALGVRGAVTSPTFVIARVHPGPVPLVHVDAYRLAGAADLDDLDLDADLAESVTVVEWGEGLAERLADAYLHVVIERSADADVRGDGSAYDPRRVTIARHG